MIQIISLLLSTTLFTVVSSQAEETSLFNYITSFDGDNYPYYFRENRHRNNRSNRYPIPNRFGNLVDENGSNRVTENEVSVTANEGHTDWTYKDQENWRNINKECAGRSQSPIDVGYPVQSNLDLDVDFHVGRQGEVELRNTGHTAELSFKDGNAITARGSALNYDEYTFQQMHFHWGAYDNEGSEHALFGQKFSAELHFVFYNSKYRSFSTAVSKKDGLTVFGVFLQASNYNNPNLEPIINGLDQIRKANSRTSVNLNLSSLLPRYRDRYFRYSGSLTTPPCSEVVNWIVFESPVKIGRSQLEKFRQLEDSNGSKLKTTWRFLQSRNLRLIETAKTRSYRRG